MEAVLYLDKENGTDYFSVHVDKWKALQEDRGKIEKKQAQEVAKMLEQLEDLKNSREFLASFLTNGNKKENVLSTKYFEEQVAILRDLNQYNS